jgi:hypothetical protein
LASLRRAVRLSYMGRAPSGRDSYFIKLEQNYSVLLSSMFRFRQYLSKYHQMDKKKAPALGPGLLAA